MTDEATEIKAAGIGYRDMNNAPVWYGAEQANAWASGWNAAVEAMLEAQKAATPDPVMEGLSNFLDRIENKTESQS